MSQKKSQVLTTYVINTYGMEEIAIAVEKLAATRISPDAEPGFIEKLAEREYKDKNFIFLQLVSIQYPGDKHSTEAVRILHYCDWARAKNYQPASLNEVFEKLTTMLENPKHRNA